MRRAALINDNNVVEHVIMVGDNYVVPEGYTLFPSDTANIGDKRDGVVIASTADPTPDLLDYAKGMHNIKLRTGFAFDLPTGRVQVSMYIENRTYLSEIVRAANADPSFSAVWIDDTWESLLNQQQILQMGVLMHQHTHTLFHALHRAINAIRAGTAKTRFQIDAILGA